MKELGIIRTGKLSELAVELELVKLVTRRSLLPK